MTCEPDNRQNAESSAYRWLRLVKVLLAILVSLLTTAKLLGAFP